MPDPFDLDLVLRQNSVRDAPAREVFLEAMRLCGHEDGPFSRERLQAFMRVEEHFQALLLYDQLDFLRQAPGAADAERDFAVNIQRICLEAANGFQRFLRTRSQWATSIDAMDDMVRATGLALHAIHGFVKWGCFLAEPGRTTPWKQLHALYSLAEGDGYARTPFLLHPSRESFKPTVQSLYLRTLVLDMLNTGNLTRIQLEIADGWFSSWCADYGLDTEFEQAQHLFYVDLEGESGMHLMRTDSHGAAMRYLRTAPLKGQIEEMQAGLRQGRLFAGFGAGAVFPVEEHTALLATLEKLHQSVIAGTQHGIEERTHFEDREVDVALGVELLLRKVREGPARPAAPGEATASAPSVTETFELSPTGLSLVADEKAPSPASVAPAEDRELQRLRVLDLSSRGYGLLADVLTGDTVPVNGLLGVRNQETGGWIIGQLVRKLPHRVRGEVLLGVEVLAYRPIRVELKANGVDVEALFLPGMDTNGRQDALLLRSADFAPERSLTIATGGASYRIRLNRIINKGADWIKARFEIEAKT